ncbi:MAG: hypothetical protein RLZZ383_1655 [Pseudomonadota bacterium]|jgi:rhamnulose-1-phosphate aldolase/alcohol dehydrogenase
MRDRYDAAAAEQAVATWGPTAGDALAQRTYTSRLLGADPALVLHGGGNTSVKVRRTDVFGDEVDVCCVKGSGWDLATIEPKGHPAVRLQGARRLLSVPNLTDEDMVATLRSLLLDQDAPNPSIEALLHAFLPATFVDHSHADAILVLTNHADARARVAEALGPGVVCLDYVKPGFDLAVAAAALLTEHPQAHAMVLLQHGLFTWGETAEESYRAHIRLVQAAEDWIARQPNVTPGAWDDGRVAQAQRRVGRVAACLRGALVRGGLRVVLDARADGQTLALLADERLDGWVAAGPITPDHVIRTKPLACVARVPQDGDDEAIRVAIEDALERYRSHYLAYVQAHIAGRPLVALDPWPRVVLVPGVGLFGVGGAPGAAAIAADIGVRTLAVKATAAGVGGFVGLPASDLFEVEYWSLEQAKLGKSKPKPLEGKVAVITGGAGAIGVGIAGQLLAAGAVVALADQDALALARAEQAVGKSKSLMTVHVDVTSPSATAAAFDAVAARFGGIDIVVPNAGIAHVAPVLELDADAWNRVLDVNATGVFLTTREAARWLTLQGVGGDIVIISSKNVFGPGEGFGAYSASKAAAHQLGRVAALELAQHGIRVNMVNPDAVFAQGAIPSGLWAAVGPDRARVRGLRTEDLPAFYRERNLLRAEVTGAHVGAAVVFFASGVTPTTGAALPVDGGVATAFPR